MSESLYVSCYKTLYLKKNPLFGEENLEPSPRPKRDIVERIVENYKVCKHIIELRQCYQEEWAKFFMFRPVLRPTGSAWLRWLLAETMKVVKVYFVPLFADCV